MTIGEFKAFLEGMGIEGAPTPEQWARIKEKIEAVEPVTLAPLPQVYDPLRPGYGKWTGDNPWGWPVVTC